MFRNELNMSLQLRTQVDCLVKKKLQVCWLVKMMMLTVSKDMKKLITIDFLEKIQLWTVLPINNSSGKIHHIYWMTHIYIYAQ